MSPLNFLIFVPNELFSPKMKSFSIKRTKSSILMNHYMYSQYYLLGLHQPLLGISYAEIFGANSTHIFSYGRIQPTRPCGWIFPRKQSRSEKILSLETPKGFDIANSTHIFSYGRIQPMRAHGWIFPRKQSRSEKILYAPSTYAFCLTNRASPTPVGAAYQWDKDLMCPAHEIPSHQEVQH